MPLHRLDDADNRSCYQLPSNDERFLIPQALDPSRPALQNWPDDALRFRYKYELLPAALIPRLIVECHDRLLDQPRAWRNGFGLEADGCRLLVASNRERRQIDILVDGEPYQRRIALSMLQNEMNRVHRYFPEAEPAELVPLPDEPDIHESFQHLCKLEKQGVEQHYPTGASRPYLVSELLDGFERPQSDRPDVTFTSVPAPVLVTPSEPLSRRIVAGIFTALGVVAALLTIWVFASNGDEALPAGPSVEQVEQSP